MSGASAKTPSDTILCNLLAPVYDRFTEGFDTQDLKNGKALLEASC
jgi:hypothetical protein